MLPVVLSEAAEETLVILVLFIRERWGEKAVNKFKNASDRKINLIASQPVIAKHLPWT